MKKSVLSLLLLVLPCSLLIGVVGCSSPAGKAATYKAKDLSPVHDTKKEKATGNVRNIDR